MAERDFIQRVHTSTSRDYVQRVVEHDKAECAAVAKQWGEAYWDGDRRFGYGGMRYDGRWRPVADALVAHYGLKPGDRVLDVGCGKGFLLYDLTQAVPGLEVTGLDISAYAIEHSKPEIRPFLVEGHCRSLPWTDGSFDLVISVNTFHNLYNFELFDALGEFQRVSKGPGYFCTESYRNESEKANLLYWQLTCETLYTPGEWAWFMDKAGYRGDYEFIYFT